MNLHEDRVIRFLDACYDAGIKNPESFILSKMPQVYSWLIGAFPRKILPTDIDGEVEICGQFLRFEFKHENALRDGRIPKGQLMALKALIQTRVFTVLLIGNNDRGETACFEAWYNNGNKSPLKDANRQDIYDFCERWSAWAEAQRRLNNQFSTHGGMGGPRVTSE